jgi:murein DD-endopeptidase MepM/ murein hydrolase activator NlpD
MRFLAALLFSSLFWSAAVIAADPTRTEYDELGDLLLEGEVARLSSPFGMREGRLHRGADWAAPSGTLVRSFGPGVVRLAFFHGTYGRLVIVDHGYGVRTWYAHCRRILVSRGQRVEAGQPVARVGHSGRATGPHLHFEIRIDGEAVDPLPLLALVPRFD